MVGNAIKKGVIIFLWFFLFANVAQGATELNGFSVSATGTTTINATLCPAGLMVYGTRQNFGTYPSTGSPGPWTFNASGASNCTAYFSGAGSLENGLFTGSPGTPDGDYWVEVAFDGTAFSPNFAGANAKYFRATRTGGVWAIFPDPYNFSTTTSRITQQNSPMAGSITPSAQVTFDYDFISTGLDFPPFVYAGVRIENLTAGFTYDTSSAEQAIVSSGNLSFTQTFTLPIGDAFMWTPYLRTASSTVVKFGNPFPFSVVQQNIQSSPFTPVPTNDSQASSTILGLGGFFSVKDLLLSKFPFNWIADSAAILESLASSTATTTIPTVAVDYSGLSLLQNIPTTTPQNLNFTFFSAATFDQVAEIDGIELMRTFLSWTLWIALIFFAWREGTRIFSVVE